MRFSFEQKQISNETLLPELAKTDDRGVDLAMRNEDESLVIVSTWRGIINLFLINSFLSDT